MPLQSGFAQNWLQTTGEVITGSEFYPAIESPAGALAVQTILSSPETGASAARTCYYLSIAAARRTIDIANPYFIPDQGAIDLLMAASRRGVKVRVMVAGIHNDNWMARQNSVRLYGPLLEAGIEIYEYNHTMLHQKTMVVDGVWSTVGTTNFDSRSFAHNEENNVCVCDGQLAKQLEAIFAADITGCDAMTLKKWRTAPLLDKLAQNAVSIFAGTGLGRPGGQALRQTSSRRLSAVQCSTCVSCRLVRIVLVIVTAVAIVAAVLNVEVHVALQAV